MQYLLIFSAPRPFYFIINVIQRLCFITRRFGWFLTSIELTISLLFLTNSQSVKKLSCPSNIPFESNTCNLRVNELLVSDISWVILSKIYLNYEDYFHYADLAKYQPRSVTNTNRLQYYNSIFTIWPTMPKADPAPAHRAHAHLFENFKDLFLKQHA